MTNPSGITLDLTNYHSILKASYAGFVKENGEKTDKPLIDEATGLRIYWLSLVLFPRDSIGGQDLPVFAKCVSKDAPITLSPGETPLVELINPAIELRERGYSISVDGLKRLEKEAK